MSGRGRGGGGRGAYFKARYGGRGRGGKPNSQSDFGPPEDQDQSQDQADRPTKDWSQLQGDLQSIDSRQYGAYKQLYGRYEHVNPQFTLSVDYIQPDPYAAPSKVRAIVPWAETGLPNTLLQSEIKRTALCDFVSRVAGSIIQSRHLDKNVGDANGGWSGPKGGAFSINAPGQEVLPRTSAMISGTESIELRFTVTLPAAGRTILGRQANQILAVNLVDIVKQSLLYANLDQPKLQQHVLSIEVQNSLRSQLHQHGLIAFVANGSILPRATGASQAPMAGDDVVKFQAPKELESNLVSSDGVAVKGMGIPRGITLLTGGGFHGKSTLLEALELGVYDHIPGDGREQVVTEKTAFKIRAEDGRSISKTDISPFISQLPGRKDTKAFSSEDASGSTSMAANIQEALEAGCKTLLIDEDSSATNLLVRDHRMQALIKNEPITPLVSKARALYKEQGVSTIIVIGGLGDWLAVADHIIAMDNYSPRYITQQAREIVQQFPAPVIQDETYGSVPRRAFRVDFGGFRSVFASRKRFITLKEHQRNAVDDPSKAESGIDLDGIDQIVETGQLRTIALILERIADMTGERSVTVSQLEVLLDENIGIDKCLPLVSLDSRQGGDLVAVRKLELTAALSRLRGLALRVDQAS